MHLLACIDPGNLGGDGAVCHANHRGDFVRLRQVRGLVEIPHRDPAFGCVSLPTVGVVAGWISVGVRRRRARREPDACRSVWMGGCVGRGWVCSCAGHKTQAGRRYGGQHADWSVGEHAQITDRARCYRSQYQRRGPSGVAASLLGSMRIFACASGSPSASNAAATPASPTVPVMSGATSTLPSASMCNVSRNSSGV
jgi:hypothetical protein